MRPIKEAPSEIQYVNNLCWKVRTLKPLKAGSTYEETRKLAEAESALRIAVAANRAQLVLV